MKNEPHHAAKDLAGRKFGRLTVLRALPERIQRSIAWECRCDCGTVVNVPATKLLLGRKRSCGCLAKEVAAESHANHGHKRGGKISKTYNAWAAMRDRCTNPRNSRWADYGGRGITVCSEWLTFDNFLRDMGEAPAGTSLDRIDNERGYEPGNCRWATPDRQARNRRDTTFIEFRGEKLSISDWSERTGIDTHTIRARIKRGWSVDRALSEPAKEKA